MTLKDYLAAPGNTASEVARRCGVSVSTITRVSKGDQWPSKQLAADIVAHTGGSVTPADLLA